MYRFPVPTPKHTKPTHPIKIHTTHKPHSSPYQTTTEALQAIYRKSGLKGLWLGTPAGIAKTVPK